MSVHMDCYGATHVGRKRSTNEDQFLVADLKKSLRVHFTSLALDHQTRLFGNSQGKLMLVADGMGGHEAGERASMLAVDGIATYALNMLRWHFRGDEQDEETIEEDLESAMEHCQDLLNREMHAIPQRNGMGTTLTMAYVVWPRAYIVHVGDSRCYLLRNNRLKQLTRDHTMAQLYRESMGEDDPPQASGPDEVKPPTHRNRERMNHMLWNVIGGEDEKLTTEVQRLQLEVGDSLLLCTDGLTRHVPDSVLEERLRSQMPANQLCDRLIEMANEAGGSDNTSVVLARFDHPKEDVNFESEAHEPMELEDSSLADTDPEIVFSGESV